jgi:crossover junction endodeoxyribonuclease RusA
MSLLFELMINGPPVSHQTKDKPRLQRWKARIRREAKRSKSLPAKLYKHEVCLKITYFYENKPPDADNIIKPIQDALNGVVYEDDRQVADTSSRLSRLDGAFRIRSASPELLKRLAYGSEFLWIRVLSAPDHEVLS